MSAEAPTVSEKREAHLRGIRVTTLSCVLGVVAGVVSWAVTSGFVAGLPVRAGIAVLAFSVVAQKPFLPRLGKDKMSKKDWLYVGFMTFDLWFITWTVLLTAGNTV
jgi:hypothetical protein